MSTKIFLKKSSVAAKVPLATDLNPGELAVNLADAKLYTKNTGGTIIELGGKLNGQPASYYTNASNLSSGTLPDARLTGTYSGINLKLNSANSIFSTTAVGSTNTDSIEAFSLANYRSSSATATGAIVFKAPTTASYIMHYLHFVGMLYTSGQSIDCTVQGYNYIAGAWIHTSKVDRGKFSPQVRLGRTPDGYSCVIFGSESTVWSYPNISLAHALLSYTGVTDAYAGAWSTSLVTNLSSYTHVTANLVNDISAVNAINLNSQPASYYTNASNLSSGTLPDARLTGTYTGISINTTGTITASVITATSDRRLKDKIITIEAALDKVTKLRGVDYVLKDGSHSSGLIAQEVEEVIPQVVSTDPSGYKSIAYGNLVGLLVEAIKELKARVEALEDA